MFLKPEDINHICWDSIKNGNYNWLGRLESFPKEQWAKMVTKRKKKGHSSQGKLN